MSDHDLDSADKAPDSNPFVSLAEALCAIAQDPPSAASWEQFHRWVEDGKRQRDMMSMSDSMVRERCIELANAAGINIVQMTASPELVVEYRRALERITARVVEARSRAGILDVGNAAPHSPALRVVR